MVSVKDPSWEGILFIDRENIAGNHETVATKLLEKMPSDPERFVAVSICPRDTNVNDNKVAYVASYKRYKITSTGKKAPGKLHRHIIKRPTLNQAFFDELMAFANNDVLAAGRFKLVDIGFTHEVVQEGGKAVGFVVYEEALPDGHNQLSVDLKTHESSNWV